MFSIFLEEVGLGSKEFLLAFGDHPISIDIHIKVVKGTLKIFYPTSGNQFRK
jgi:hypothetical protein